MDVQAPMFVNACPVDSAAQMAEAVLKAAPQQDIIIKAAAVSDYTPATTAQNKIKKADGDMSIPLRRTVDILKTLGTQKQPGQVICGFSMETEKCMLENSRKKLAAKTVI